MPSVAEDSAPFCAIRDKRCTDYFKELAHKSTVGTYIIENGAFTYANPASALLSGYNVEELLGMPVESLLHPDDTALYRENVRMRLEGVVPSVRYELRIVKKSGEVATLEVFGTCFTNGENHAVIMGNWIDISDRKRMESELRQLNGRLERLVEERTAELAKVNEQLREELRGRKLAQQLHDESHNRFFELFKFAPVSMMKIGLDGSYRKVNDAFCRFVGYPEAELLRLTYWDIAHPGDLRSDQLVLEEFLSGSRDHYEAEKRWFHKSGHLVWGLLSVAMVRDGQKRPAYFICQIQDITSLKKAGNALGYLTAREREILSWMITGRLNKQIARELGISEKTVRIHRVNVMRKMKTRSVIELARIAANAGLQPAGKPG